MFSSQHVVSTAAELRRLVARPRPAQETKVLDNLDGHCRQWIGRSPFVVIATSDAAGRIDVSPKGDHPGFVRILDDQTLAVPDRPGNRRMDSMFNLLERPQIGLMFMIPGRGEVLRAAGTSLIVTDPELLATLEAGGRVPNLALVVTIHEVMFHCGKSVIRSKLWSPEDWPAIDDLASYAECLADQASTDETVGQMEARFAAWHHGDELY